MAAGIDDISVYIPRLYVDASDFAHARGMDPAKLVKGLGISVLGSIPFFQTLDIDQIAKTFQTNFDLKILN